MAPKAKRATKSRSASTRYARPRAARSGDARSKAKGGVRQIASDGYSDDITGRGMGNDRAGRPRGGQGQKPDEALLELYNSNGAMQTIVNKPADDSTRKGFKMVTDDPEDDAMLQARWVELDLQARFRDLVKFMQIYPQGSALFIGLQTSNLNDQRQFALPMSQNIMEVDFVNALNHPGDFTVQSAEVYDPTMREWGKVFFRINGAAVHPSWVVWLASEWDRKENKGLSRVNSTYDAVVAQDSALWSVSTMVQQLSMMIYESTAFTNLSPAQKELFSSHVRSFMETNSFFGIKEGEKVDRLNYQFSGLKDILDFIFQNISLYSQIPQNILIGRAQGILTAAEEDTINYYAFINQFQKSKLERLYRQMIDILLLEKRNALWRKHQGKLEYSIEWLTLWELAPTLKSEIEERNAKRDKLDVESGKVRDPDELRLRDPFYLALDKEKAQEDAKEDDDTNRTAAGDNPKKKEAGDAVSIASKMIITKRDDKLGFSVVVTEWNLVDPGTWEAVVLDQDQGVTGSKGKLLSNGEEVFTDLFFKGDRWTAEKVMTFIDFELPKLLNSASPAGDMLALDDINQALKRAKGEWDALPVVGKDKGKLQVDVKHKAKGDEQKVTTVSKKQGIYVVASKGKDDMPAATAFVFEKKKWKAADAKQWLESKGFHPKEDKDA